MKKFISDYIKSFRDFLIPTLLICFVFSLDYASAQQTQVFYVSPQGNDLQKGTEDAPFQSLEKAKIAIRHFRAANSMPAGGIKVLLRQGEYQLPSTFELEQQDSGYPSAPISYEAYPGEQVIITGGYDLPVHTFQKVKDPDVLARLDQESAEEIVVVNLPGLGIEDFGELKQYGAPGYDDVVPAPELFFNDQAMVLARYPNQGFLHISRTIDKGSTSRWGDEGDDPMIFQYHEDRPSSWQDLKNVWLFGFWFSDWGFATNRIGKIDTKKKEITTAFPDTYGLRTDDRPIGGRFYYYNVLEELDSAGEWYLDREAGNLYLYPPESMDQATIQLSMQDVPFIQCKQASYLAFRNLTFQLNRASGLVIEGGYGNTVERCKINKIGLHGILADGFDHTINDCELGIIGSAAIKVSGGDRVKLIRGNHRVTDNHIYNFGRIVQTYEPGIGLSGVGLTASHNKIHDAPHSAILFNGNDHQIVYNNIFEVCKISDDAGAVYGGRDWTSFGTRIAYNFIHDILGHLDRTHAIYLDDQLSGIKIHGNIIMNVTRPMLIGGGDYNTITNNLIIGKTENSTADKGAIKLDQRGLNWQDVGPDHTLYQRLREIPYADEPWKSKYPQLINIMEVGPKTPVGNVVENNVVLNHYPIIADDQVNKNGEIKNNWQEDNFNTAKIEKEILEGDVEAFDDFYKKINKQLPGFEPIPLNKIGMEDN